MLDKLNFVDAVIAGNVKKVEEFLRNGMDPNATLDWAMLRPLHFAVQNDSIHAAMMLVKYGADPMMADICGDTPLDFALEMKPQNSSMLAVLSNQQRKYWC